MTDTPTGGRMTWAAALAGPLTGTTCLWQDLDGLHVAAPPADPPITSHLWGWTPDGHLIRVRLDEAIAYIATHEPTAGEATEPWDRYDGRVRAAAQHPTGGPQVGTRWVQVIEDGIANGAGPITFIRPADDRL